MRNNIVHIGAGELTYEIRAIVTIAEQLASRGIPVQLENIGDPVAKGEPVPGWMKQVVADLALQDCSYAYCPTKGLLETREFLLRGPTAGAGCRSPRTMWCSSTVSATRSRRCTVCCAGRPG